MSSRLSQLTTVSPSAETTQEAEQNMETKDSDARFSRCKFISVAYSDFSVRFP
eukprot:CAMPEP_0203884636 /NCGR_PEP_ID=MMETSP0359-20131031/28675_1 /ASSEMBLY_ACC=CAM_ASM_000338 /TAXON_ID=268821 /ORGANISM="Scrippsiella Hangoei, Strain SHTV-5" /LENGTH=52 /DNA_ID=CAMNT_0050805141 /DNA_START=41 /DNA_END=196 /DNA_ORIENTATION=-